MDICQLQISNLRSSPKALGREGEGGREGPNPRGGGWRDPHGHNVAGRAFDALSSCPTIQIDSAFVTLKSQNKAVIIKGVFGTEESSQERTMAPDFDQSLKPSHV